MKKSNLFLLLSILPLISCANTDSSTANSGSTANESTSVKPKTDILKDYKSSFNASTIVSTQTEGSADIISSNYETFLADDYLTMYAIDENGDVFRTQYYEKINDKVVKKSLTKKATIISEEVKDFNYFGNVLQNFDLEIIENGLYEIDVNQHLNDLMTLNYQLSGALTGSLDTIETASFTRANDILTYNAKYVSNGIILTLETTFGAKTEEHVEKLTVPNENEFSKSFNALMTKLKEQNFTLELRQNNELIQTIQSMNDRLYFKENRKGYLKQDTGYLALIVSDDETEVTLSSTNDQNYSSLQADFEVDGKILKETSKGYIPLPEIEGIDTSFELIDCDYLTNSSLIFSIADNELTITSNEYSFLFKDIGTTDIQVDFDNYIIKEDWTSQDPSILEAMNTLLGTEISIPYFDTGYTWAIVDQDTDYLDLISEEVPSNKADGLIQSYLSELMDTEFTKLSREELQPYLDSFDIFPYDEVNLLLFNLHNGYYMEVFNGYNSFFSGVGLSFNVLPEALQ